MNIHVQEGNVEVHLTDFGSTNLVKKSDSKDRILQFHIKGEEQKDVQVKDAEVKQARVMHLNKVNGNFMVYQVSIKSLDEEKAASYSIGYSSGKSQFFLQDGLIVDYNLESKTAHSFFYCNSRTEEHVVYTLSAQSAQYLKDLKMKFYSFDDFGE